jgi:hypothetical protein
MVLVRMDLLRKTRLVGSIAVYLCLGVYLVLKAVYATIVFITPCLSNSHTSL